MLRNEIWIIRMILGCMHQGINFYILFLPGDIDVPLMFDKRICFYDEDGLLVQLKKFGLEILPDELNDEIDLTYNVNKVFDLISKKNIDNDATLINSINILLDLINAIPIKLAEKDKEILYAFADHLTFSRRYGAFLRTKNITRESLADIFFWMNGAVLSNATFNKYL